MCYKLQKPITEKQKSDFIVEYNHNKGLRIEDTEKFLFALEPNEIMGEKEIEIEVPEYNEVTGEQVNTHSEIITIPYPVINPNYEQEQAQKEQERINALNLTKADFWIALLDKNITKDMVKEKINLIPDEKLKAKTLIRLEDADHFYRGDPAMNVVGAMFGISIEDLNHLFEYKELPTDETATDTDL